MHSIKKRNTRAIRGQKINNVAFAKARTLDQLGESGRVPFLQPQLVSVSSHPTTYSDRAISFPP